LREQALYRKYRSRNFAEVVGQDHVTRALTSALETGRISHAYLFTGGRGVGKTSVARILAKSLNCTGQDAKPCGKCLSCQAAINGNLDIIEIDAASNRGIDEIRDLKEKINVAPSLGQYKVYIIDEVHMLTEAAFNALLKTLEEPPAHAVFILATTEAHKLPATIISRTQRYNFHQIEAATIVQHLAKVAAAEKITVSPAALSLIAEAAAGSFRDGLSLLDQAASLSQAIEADDVRQLLGWGNEAELEKLYQTISQGQIDQALELSDQLHQHGAQPAQLVNQLIKLVRHDIRQQMADGASIERQVALMESLVTSTKSALPQYALEIAIARFQSTKLAQPTTKTAVEPVAVAASPASPEPKPASPAPVASNGPDPDFDTRWMKALAQIKAYNNSLYALLCSCSAHQTSSGIELIARFGFHRDRLLEPKNLTVIEAAVAKAFNRKLPVTCRLQQTEPVKASSDPAAELVSSALEILGGEIVE
jgi:DNA polymerase-3 subunit gamma/tau